MVPVLVTSTNSLNSEQSMIWSLTEWLLSSSWCICLSCYHTWHIGLLSWVYLTSHHIGSGCMQLNSLVVIVIKPSLTIPMSWLSIISPKLLNSSLVLDLNYSWVVSIFLVLDLKANLMSFPSRSSLSIG